MQRVELQPNLDTAAEVMKNVILPIHLNEMVGLQPLQGTTDSMLSAPEQVFKQHRLSDLAWMILCQPPTEELFTIDRRPLQVIAGRISCGGGHFIVIIYSKLSNWHLMYLTSIEL